MSEAFVRMVEMSPEGQRIRDAYDRLELGTALKAYLDRETDETTVAALLQQYSTELADVALSRGLLDIAAVRFGAEHLTSGMNQACNEKHGFQEPDNRWQALMIKTGRQQPQPEPYIRLLDNSYWNKQFPEGYQSGKLSAPKQPGETEQQCLAGYIYTSIHGFIFAPFTFMRW